MSNKANLALQTIVKGSIGFLLLGALLFGSAGTLAYPNAWVLLITLYIVILAMGVSLLIKYPETLKKRLKTKETQTTQKGFVALSGLAFLASFVLSGLDERFVWSHMPLGVSVAGWCVMLVGYTLYFIVVLQNSYASRVVEIQKDQTVIQTGPYALVRHPMYLAALLLFLSMPLVLGSYIALVPMLIFPVALVMRIMNEESVLLTGLAGYADYTQKTKFRLIPYLW